MSREARALGSSATWPGRTKALAKAMELARAIAGNAPLSNYAAINALQRIHDSGYDEGMFFESMIASLTQSTPEAIDRMRAFVEKRAARVAAPGTRKGDAGCGLASATNVPRRMIRPSGRRLATSTAPRASRFASRS
jgi:hypothetical protein